MMGSKQKSLFGLSRKFQLQNRRYLGNKFKLLKFIEYIINKECGSFESFCDIFAGTGVVGAFFNDDKKKIISNDLLYSNFVSLSTFLKGDNLNIELLAKKINRLNKLKPNGVNYFSSHFGQRYFTDYNARKIGIIREKIEEMAENREEKMALISSLIYAVDKVANTVGHYDAYRKLLDCTEEVRLLLPDIEYKRINKNEVYCEDANKLIEKIRCDILYLDPPYNSRQYCDTYHLLENLALWEKPPVFGKAGKMDRSNLKSAYCYKNATDFFEDLTRKANCKHILVSYNNTGESKGERSNARISDEKIIEILKKKGRVKIYKHPYKAYTAGKGETKNHMERVFYCKVLQ